MAEAKAETNIGRSPDEVWKVVGDFGGIAAWMPGVESCTVDGDERTIEMMGLQVVERLVRRDDDQRTLVYALSGGPVPVERHEATITVHADGDGSRVTWDVDAEPDDMAQAMGGVYQQALDALKRHVGG